MARYVASQDLEASLSPVLEWAAKVVGPGAEVIEVERLRTYTGPWLLRIEDDGVGTEVVLKCGPAAEWREPYLCEATALRLAAEQKIPVPRLLGSDLDVAGSGRAALLLSRLEGTAAIPAVATAERLRTLGQVASMIHRTPLTPSDHLPLRTRHTEWTNLALWRRWARRYQATSEDERESVLREFVGRHPLGGMGAMTGAAPWTIAVAQQTLSTTTSTALLDAAGERLLETPVPEEATVFVHGDLWQGNTLWDGDRLTGVIDWEVAGAGHPGVDLGCLRWDAAMLFGTWAADEVLVGWEEGTGLPASSVAYWDVVAVLNYPTDVGVLVGTLREQGRPDLDAQTLTERRDAYLTAALDELSS